MWGLGHFLTAEAKVENREGQQPDSEEGIYRPGEVRGEGNGTPLQYCCLENPWTGEPGGLPSMGRTESDTTEAP